MAQPVNLTASGLVKNAPGKLRGILINSTSSGTIILRDGTSGSGTAINGTLTPAAGQFIDFGEDGIDFSQGIYATIGGTLNATFLYN
jgi:hypothetical protein